MNFDEAAKESSERYERIKSVIDAIFESECLDSIVVLITYSREGVTQSEVTTKGNHYANVAMCDRFLIEEKESWRKGQ